jgi:protein-disulfide isomerase
MFGKMRPIAFIVLLLAGFAVPVQSDETSGQILGGSLNAPIRLEVFSDFECSACREFYLRTIRPLLQEYCSKDKVCVVYYEYPLSYHKYARQASLYSEAASRIGQQQLLAVRDSIYTDQAIWSQDGSLEATVSKALSRDDFQKLKKIMQETAVNNTLEKQIEWGRKKDIKATPTLFIYYIGKQQKVEGLVTYLVMKQFIDSIVK